MAKNKNRKKKVTPPNGGYKKFINDMMDYMNANYELNDTPFTNAEKRDIYELRLQLRRPEAANKLVSVKEINKLYAHIKHLQHKKKTNVGAKVLSTYEMLLFYSYMNTITKRTKKVFGKNHTEYISMNELVGDAFKGFYTFYLLDVFSAITRISSPTFKYYGATTRIGTFVKDDLRLELITSLSGIPAQKKHIKLNGNFRPAYRLGKINAQTYFEWCQIKAETLPDSIQKKHSEYSFYIQSHAINRMKERLDLLDSESVNYTIWESTVSKPLFIRHKHYTLLAVKVHGIRIGYFVVEPIDDILIIKTFLFITHSCTPEGDKLKENTGLGKSDISYWKIDRLSTFVNLDKEKYPKLMQLFTDAGMKDLSQLKDKDFDIDSIQDANLNKLRDYLVNSQQYKEAKEEDVVIHA